MKAFAALADDTRLEILEALSGREASVNELVGLFELSQPAISQHLKILREAGLVQVRPEAQRRIYSIDPKGLKQISGWLGRYRKYWASRFDNLERHMDGTEER